MKNKPATYLLLLAVAAVWGMIIHRVWKTLSDDNETAPVVSLIKKEAFDDYSVKTDTLQLLTNGRDPFGLSTPLVTVTHNLVTTVVKTQTAKPANIQVDWNFVIYSGYIKNPATKKLIAIMSVNGKKAMLTEGETFERVKLLKNAGDSLKISYNGAVKFIKLHSDI